MPWKQVENVFESRANKKRTLESIFNEAAAGGLEFATLRMTRTLRAGSEQTWNGFYGFDASTDTTTTGEVIQVAAINPDKQITFFGSVVGEGFALVPIADKNGPCKKNIDILVDALAYGENNWTIVQPDIRATLQAKAEERKKELKPATPVIETAEDLVEIPEAEVVELPEPKKRVRRTKEQLNSDKIEDLVS